jgi:polysaccharide deacetylase family protein (PEP-CTERM system associated)
MKSPNFSLTIDVEEWYQAENLREAAPLESWERMESRVEAPTVKLLSTLVEEKIEGATFFVLGQVAQKHPGLIRKIADSGFEIASHGMDHVSNFQLSPEKLQWNLATSKKLLEDITGREVAGYRAPSFTVNERVLEELRGCGYHYDSSFNDISYHDRYGKLDLSGFTRMGAGVYRHPDGDFFELPISNFRIGNFPIPWGGGGYFRLIPGAVFRWGVRKVLERESHFLFYMHPWEIDDAQPRMISRASFRGFRHYNNLALTLPRLRKLLKELRLAGIHFVAARDLTGGINAAGEAAADSSNSPT